MSHYHGKTSQPLDQNEERFPLGVATRALWPEYYGYQSFRHTVISPHDYSQNITVIVINWRFFVCSPQRVCWSPILD